MVKRYNGMKSQIKNLIKKLLPIADALVVPFVFPAALLMKCIRLVGVQYLPLCKNALLYIGVFPIRNHYYEPQFDSRNQKSEFSADRNLQGINWNVIEQLEILKRLTFSQELLETPQKKSKVITFHFNNGAFESGDAEYWYQLIRYIKPKRIFEIGSGYSTLMAVNAIERNKEENASYRCEHVCIEPYEMPWLEKVGVSVVREKVEDVELSFFSTLQENDFLFIDSSHIIRPQGDVLFEYLELLPSLNKGVIVHIHDIFSPKNYLSQWLKKEIRFWNEQYLLEAFLSHNDSWKILGALNFLHHNYYDDLKLVAPFLAATREPGSFYIQKYK